MSEFVDVAFIPGLFSYQGAQNLLPGRQFGRMMVAQIVRTRLFSLTAHAQLAPHFCTGHDRA
jgi:hypothetical protein